MSSDLVECLNLLGEEGYQRVRLESAKAGLDERQTFAHKDRQLLSIPDKNNGDYSSNQIQFDTVAWEKQWKVLRKCILAVPWKKTSSYPAGSTAPSPIIAQDYNIDTQICHNSNVLSMLTGFQFSDANGQTVYNNINGSYFKSQYDLNTTKTDDWYKTQADFIQFSNKDASDSKYMVGAPTIGYALPSSNPATGTAFPVSTVQLPASSLTNASKKTSLTGGISQGFMERCDLYKLNVLNNGQYNSSDKSIEGISYIPLWLFDQFFDAHNFPMINDRWNINFYLGFSPCPANSFPNGSTVYPASTINYVSFQYPSTVPAPVIKIGNSRMSSCRLYYEKIDLSPVMNLEMEKRLAKGFMKEIWYKTVEPPKILDLTTASNGTIQLPMQVSTNSRNVSRVIVLPYAKNAFKDPSSFAPALTYSNPNSSSTQLKISNVNILVNGVRYFSNDLRQSFEFYDQIKAGFPFVGDSKTSLVSYKDFLNGKAYYTFDIQKIRDKLTSPNDTIALEILGDISGATDSDGNPGEVKLTLVYLVEIDRGYKMQMGDKALIQAVGASL